MGIDLTPLWEAKWFIQVHALAALGALVLGAVQFLAPKGTLPHKTLGTIWVGLMSAVALSSAMILDPPREGGSFFDRLSWIHGLTLITAVGLMRGVSLLRAGGPNLKRHARSFLLIYIFGLIVAGIFTLAPGRIMHEVVFG